MVAGYILLTLAIYLLAKFVYKRTNQFLFSPLILCPAIILSLIISFHIPYENYAEGGKWLTLMLQPATVALAVPMYKYRATVKKYFTEIIVSVFGGAVIAIVTSIAIASFLGISAEIMASLAPRSVTTPIAMSVSKILGGNPSITAVFVICTGITGTLISSILLKYTPIKSPVTRGMMYGVSAHGTGTAKAFEFGQVEGVIASLAMIFMGIITTIIAPQVVTACLSVLRT